MKETPYKLLEDDQKKKLGKNNESKMTLYNALSRNSQVKNYKIDLLTQEYEKFSISNEETIDSGFTHDSMLLAKVTAIKESKDLTTLPLDEIIGNLKVYETILEGDDVASKPIKEKVMPIALKANITRGQTSSNSTCQEESDEEEEINLMAKNFGKLLRKGVKKHDKFNICKVKTKGGELKTNKARLVAQGYNQQERIDYNETYAPVARLESIRNLLAYACCYMFKLFQMDVKSAFLNGVIDEEVYVAQPPGFVDFQKPNHVYKLKKALYGLKQAPKAGTMSNSKGSVNKGEMEESSKKLKRKFETMKKARMESREMLLSIHHSLKMILDIISKMNRKLEDEKIKSNDKGKEKVNDF
ncbi:copia protein [Tanacetum coccineum]